MGIHWEEKNVASEHKEERLITEGKEARIGSSKDLKRR